VTYRYDTRSRLERIERAASPNVEYAYTTSGKLSGVTVGSRSVAYGYDLDDHVKSVTGPAGATTVIEWEPGGVLPLAIHDGTLYQRRCYDSAGRLKELLNATSPVSCGDVGPAIVAGFQYTYGDGRGNRTSEVAFGQGSSETIQYGYDAADRLTGVQYPGRAVVYQLAGDGTRLGEKRRRPRRCSGRAGSTP
jgi:large repetitive protein